MNDGLKCGSNYPHEMIELNQFKAVIKQIDFQGTTAITIRQ